MNLSIKNTPEDLVRKLRTRAERHHRSLQGELMAIIEAAVAYEPEQSASGVLSEIRTMGIVTPSEATTMVRHDRDARA
ncbi:FitA-like ribbon-helix-helix domain-containing protein [Acetobacter malorum]|uniref:FitA-like ribbon-helix-helix domain-containing protein n=1 Tax=Acetobacter malorum TaxID=178901 RepID=UPI0039E740C8